MKNLLFLVLCLFACTKNNSIPSPSYAVQVSNQTLDPVLDGIQDKIYNSFVQSLMSKSDAQILTISEQLATMYADKQLSLVQYWRAYASYYHAIYFMQSKDQKNAEKAIDKAIDLLKDIDKKNAEDYALLAMAQGFSIQFKGMRAMFISQSISKNIKAALAIDAENIRAHYVGGSNDYYTPEKYGGGKNVEKYLKKAISLPSQKTPNPYLPSWGKEEAYEILVKYYIKKGKMEEAKKYYQEGVGHFPQSYLLNQLAPKLVGQ